MLRLLVDDLPRSGAWNMAVDEALIESALHREIATLRLYRWSEPTVSLGHFQKPEEIAADPLLAGLPWVKRLSGGGAILHHHEWTYSVALPPAHPATRRPFDLYDRIHEQFIAWLQSRGVPAQFRGAVRSDVELPPGEPFLCFGRGDPRDVILKGHKILGSAQRRRRGAVLQHGSLLLSASPQAPQFPGLSELSGNPGLTNELPQVLVEKLTPVLGGAATLHDLSADEIDCVNSWTVTRYSQNSHSAD